MKKEKFYPDAIGRHIPKSRAEMSENDHNFLIYLLHKYKPRKILEVGVSGGGTSALLLNNSEAQVYGVDVAKEYYRDKNLPVGFEIKRFCSADALARHTLYVGYDIIEVIDQIGDEIDFVLLDTMHSLPGELLHFFAVYPFFANRSVLVLHDLSLNFFASESACSMSRLFPIATKLLFCMLGSRCKQLPDIDNPNIGALEIDDLTRKSIDSTFFGLTSTWNYFPDKYLNKYLKFIGEHYNTFCLNVFNQCIIYQEKLVARQKRCKFSL